jgi:hypothetical protein
MRIPVLLLVVIGIVGLVFYLGWFRVSSNSSDGKANITITVDKDKIEADKNKTQEKIKTWDAR